MTDISQILILLGSSVTLFSSIVWLLLIAFSVVDSNTLKEKQVKHIALCLFIIHIAVWTFLLSYHYYPSIALVLNITGFLGMVLVPVQLYRLICKLSETDHLKAFSLWHYALPIVVVGVLAVWSLFVPHQVQLWLIENRGDLHPDYSVYSLLFTSKQAFKLLFTVVYLPLALLRLYRYYQEINQDAEEKRKPAMWVILFMTCVIAIFIGTLSTYLYPRGEVVARWPAILCAVCLLFEQSIIGYHLISRDFLLYIKPEEPKKKPAAKKMHKSVSKLLKVRSPKNNPQEESETFIENNPKLSQKDFDAYMKNHKPWLNPQLHMTDLIEPFQTTRNRISAFVNRTYGVNFNRYVNGLRLQEVERLAAKPANAGKSRSVLAIRAGFANNRSYRRAVEAENKDAGDKLNLEEKRGGGHE